MIGDDNRQDCRLKRSMSISVLFRRPNHNAWLFVIEENRNMAEGKDRKKFCAAARK
jgi:hypothetical protein